MATILKNVDLAPKIQAWETCAVNAFDVALFSGNWTAAYSVDSGSTFSRLSPADMTKLVGNTFCCDQIVHYVPQINTLVWALLSNEGPILLAVASPADVKNSKGRTWTLYHVTPAVFGWRQESFDYPDLSFGDSFVYLTFNLEQQGGAVILRMPVGHVQERAKIHAQWVHIRDSSYICPAQLTGNQGWFGVQRSPSRLRVFTWKELPASPVQWFDVDISTIPTEDWTSITPDGDDWLPPTSKIGTEVTGAARSRQDLWLAWSGARKAAGARQNRFSHPHIGLAIINVQSKKLLAQHYIWNPEFAFAWPSLAANADGQVGISLAWGGGAHYAQHGVGTVSGGISIATTTSGRSAGSGGHYVKTRMAFPNVGEFVAGGFNSVKDPKNPAKAVNHPHYVVFR